MKLRKLLLKLLLALLAATLIAVPLRAQQQEAEDGSTPGERILQYVSRIVVQRDASLQVRETILVRALGEQIRHGIYRDFPTNYRDAYGNRYRVRFTLDSAQRDGRPEIARVETHGEGVRIYLGDQETFVSHGVHEYVFNYSVTRELGFFADHDELYWNVTGNEWGFPIDRAGAVVVLPPGVPREAIHVEGYTGPSGSKERDLRAAVDENGEAVFSATRALAPNEGLTIVATWPKGYVTEPSAQQKFQWLLEDNSAGLVALIGLILVVLVEFAAWVNVGRDPKPGTIMPLYEAPAGMSAAAVRYLARMGYDDKTFASLLVSLAAKRCLEISQESGLSSTYTLKRTGRKGDLTPDEQMVLERLFESSDTLRLVSTNHERVRGAIKALKSSLATRMEQIYFLRNGKYLVPGLVLSGLTFLGVVVAAEPEARPVALFMCLWLSIWTLGVAVLAIRVVSLWRGAFHSRGFGKISYIGAIFMTAFALPFFLGELFGLFTFGTAVSFPALIGLIAIAATNFIFHELLKAPTHSGRELLDKVDGFKMFLGATTDPDRPGIVVNNDITTFEKYLPYAMALDLEEQWTAKFSQALAAAAAAGSSTAHVSSLTALTAAGGLSAISDFSGSLTSAVGSASTAPGSSSGSGGGGSSGGGGGGGGGGGW